MLSAFGQFIERGGGGGGCCPRKTACKRKFQFKRNPNQDRALTKKLNPNVLRFKEWAEKIKTRTNFKR